MTGKRKKKKKKGEKHEMKCVPDERNVFFEVPEAWWEEIHQCLRPGHHQIELVLFVPCKHFLVVG